MEDLLVIAVWVICGAFAYAIDFAYFQRAYPKLAEEDYRSDRIFSAVVALLGPLGLVSALLYIPLRKRPGKYGLKWK